MSHGSARPSQRAKPLRSAERKPLTFSVMMRMRRVAPLAESRRVYTSAPSPLDARQHTLCTTSTVYSRDFEKTRFVTDFRHQFLAFALAREVLRFGEFVTKAGRKSPYFFNAGLFNDGESLRQLGRYYAQTLIASGVAGDQLFGPAYKGITLAAACRPLEYTSCTGIGSGR